MHVPFIPISTSSSLSSSSSFNILKMGNCICAGSALSHDDKNELKASEIGSGSCNGWETETEKTGDLSQPLLDAMLKSGEVYHLIPPQKQQQSLQGKSCNGGRVKIVVTKKQLQLLLKTAEQLQLGNVRFQSVRKRGRKKWRPSLASIPEL